MALFRRNKEETAAQDQGSDERTECVHGHLIPRWDRAEDMGVEARISYYLCESCGDHLSPAEAREVAQQEVQRLRTM